MRRPSLSKFHPHLVRVGIDQSVNSLTVNFQKTIQLHDIESEAKQAPVSYRTQMLGKVRNYRRSLDDAGKTLGRQQLTVGGPSATNYGFDREDRMTTAQRSKLMQGTQSLNRTSESIARSQKVASETDQIGVDIIDELGTQRDSLLRTRERLTDTDSNLVKSRKILRNMARRVITDKIILCIIVIVELATLAGLVYWKFFSK